MIYDKIYFIGTGHVGRACLTILANYCNQDELCCLSVDKEDVSIMKITSERLGIRFFKFDKTTLHEFLLGLREKILIISAHNKYIFTKDVVEKINITIINFHNAYLPEYRGRNAPTWEIFNQEKYGGATWHLVEPEIDTGDIIVQRKVPINANDTALDLLIRSAKAGIALFEENVAMFLSGDYVLRQSELPGKLYMSNQLPNDGWLDVNWSMAKAYAFLRAMDYKGWPIMPVPKVQMGGRECIIEGYKICEGSQEEGRRALRISDLDNSKELYCIFRLVDD